MANVTEEQSLYQGPTRAAIGSNLTAAQGAYYTQPVLDRMTLQDLIYADKLRVAKGALPAPRGTFVNPWEIQTLIAAPPAPGNATAGSPGVFGPKEGVAIPTNLANLTSINPTAVPATAWTTGQRVVLLDGSFAYWNATAWTVGAAP
jgi:hypothetical protein